MSNQRDERSSPSLPSLHELSRIMDVASALRRERDTTIKEFNVDETKILLRQRLLEAAEVAGESLTASEVDAAIEQYYESLHAFKPPQPGIRLTLARLYIRRGPIGLGVLAIAAVLATILWVSSVLRNAATDPDDSAPMTLVQQGK